MAHEKGTYVARVRTSDGLLLTRFHYVESEIANREITACGRQMGPLFGTLVSTATEVRQASVPPLDLTCRRCPHPER